MISRSSDPAGSGTKVNLLGSDDRSDASADQAVLEGATTAGVRSTTITRISERPALARSHSVSRVFSRRYGRGSARAIRPVDGHRRKADPAIREIFGARRCARRGPEDVDPAGSLRSTPSRSDDRSGYARQAPSGIALDRRTIISFDRPSGYRACPPARRGGLLKAT